MRYEDYKEQCSLWWGWMNAINSVGNRNGRSTTFTKRSR